MASLPPSRQAEPPPPSERPVAPERRARLLHVISGLRRGGAELSLLRLATSPEMAGFVQSVLGVHADATVAPEFIAKGIPARTLELARIRNLVTRLPQIGAGLMQLRRCDLLNGIMYHGSLLATLGALSGPKIPLVWNIRHSLDNWSEEKQTTRQVISLLGKLSRHADCIIYDSNRCKVQHAAFGYVSDRAVLVPNGVDTEEFRPNEAHRAAWRSRLNLPDDALLVGHVARLDPIKAHATALAAAELVAARDPRAHFVFVGPDDTAPPVRQFLAFSNFAERFHFLGERSDVHAIMPALDLFWLTSLSESHPNVILEAMSSGVPCVSTDVGDVRDILGDGRRITAVDDVSGLAATVLAHLSLSDADRAALGRAARTTVVEQFSLERMSGRYAEIYASVLEARGSHSRARPQRSTTSPAAQASSERLLYISFERLLPSSAAATHVREICSGLTAQGFSVRLNAEERPVAPSLPERALRYGRVLARGLAGLRSSDVLFFRAHFAGLPLALCARALGRPTIHEINGGYEDAFITHPRFAALRSTLCWMQRAQYRLANALVAVTPDLVSWARSEAGHGNVFLVTNAANTRLFNPDGPKVRRTRDYVLFFGGLVRWHGVDVMLQAAASAAWPAEIDLVVAGPIVDESLRPALQQLPSNVSYLGAKPQAELPALIRGALAALVPISDPSQRSQRGVMPLKLFEALACGTPVIVTDLPGQAEFVRATGSGLVVPIGDVEGLARAVATLAADRLRACELGRAGAAAVLAEHSWDTRAKELAAVIRNVLAKD